MLFLGEKQIKIWEQHAFKYPIIYDQNSKYQNIKLTNDKSEFRMYLNGAIQFSSRDEYRYHEALIHIAASQLDGRFDALILGGGEGLAAREVLKYQELKSVDIVDIDPAITDLSKSFGLIKDLNKGSLEDKRTNIVNEDAFVFLKNSNKRYDIVFIDLPDPSNESLSRLYSKTFYKLVRERINDDGLMVTQATSPELTRKSFWCIDETLRSSGFLYTMPYHVNIPSFGNWGFIIARNNPNFHLNLKDTSYCKFLDNELLPNLFYFPKDVNKVKVGINDLDTPKLMHYYLEHWKDLQSTAR